MALRQTRRSAMPLFEREEKPKKLATAQARTLVAEPVSTASHEHPSQRHSVLPPVSSSNFLRPQQVEVDSSTAVLPLRTAENQRSFARGLCLGCSSSIEVTRLRLQLALVYWTRPGLHTYHGLLAVGRYPRLQARFQVNLTTMSLRQKP